MQYGISIPNFGPYFDIRRLATLSRDAEEVGWDGFFLWDHVYWALFPISDPWMALTAIALQTTRLRIGTMVTPLPRRRPVKLARETVTLDHVSSGRLILGIGLGVRPQEWEHLGDEADLVVRGRMLDEGLQVLERLWRGDAVKHHGEHYTVHVRDLPGHAGAVPFAPPAHQQPRIPVWVGGRWPNRPPFRRGALWDGIIPTSVRGGIHERLTPEQLRECVRYTTSLRVVDQPLEVAIGGHTDGNDLARDRAHVAAYQQAGATWWLEDLSPWAFGWQSQGDWPMARMEERVRQGPPR